MTNILANARAGVARTTALVPSLPDNLRSWLARHAWAFTLFGAAYALWSADAYVAGGPMVYTASCTMFAGQCNPTFSWFDVGAGISYSVAGVVFIFAARHVWAMEKGGWSLLCVGTVSLTAGLMLPLLGEIVLTTVLPFILVSVSHISTVAVILAVAYTLGQVREYFTADSA